MSGLQQVENQLRLCQRALNVTPGSAELHRLSCEAHILDALRGKFDGDVRRRLERLVATLQAATSASAQRKTEVLLDIVLPTLCSLNLLGE